MNSNTIESNQLTNESLIPNAGEKISISIDRDIFEWDKKYYMALKAYDAENQSSEISNIATFKNSDLPKKGGLAASVIFGIILFCMSYLTASIMVYSIWKARKSKPTIPKNQTENGSATFQNNVVKEEKIKPRDPIRIESSVRLTVR